MNYCWVMQTPFFTFFLICISESWFDCSYKLAPHFILAAWKKKGNQSWPPNPLWQASLQKINFSAFEKKRIRKNAILQSTVYRYVAKKPFWCGGENATHFKNIFAANSSLRSHLSVKSFDFCCILQFTSAILLKIGDIFQRSLQFSKSIWLV